MKNREKAIIALGELLLKKSNEVEEIKIKIEQLEKEIRK